MVSGPGPRFLVFKTQGQPLHWQCYRRYSQASCCPGTLGRIAGTSQIESVHWETCAQHIFGAGNSVPSTCGGTGTTYCTYIYIVARNVCKLTFRGERTRVPIENTPSRSGTDQGPEIPSRTSNSLRRLPVARCIRTAGMGRLRAGHGPGPGPTRTGRVSRLLGRPRLSAITTRAW